MSFQAFFDYLLLEKKYSSHTVTSYKTDISSFLEFCQLNFELNRIDHVNYSIIRNWIVVLVDSGISNRSINRKIASLKAYYKFLLKIAVIEESPLIRHKALKVSKNIEVPFSETEMNIVFNKIYFQDSFEGERDRLIIELLYSTGIRRSELLNLTIDDIDFSVKTIKVLGKRNKERIVPILNQLLETIKKYLIYREEISIKPSVNYLLLTKNGNKIYETLVYRVINNYFSKVSSKVKKSPHILRHTFATHMLNKGADLNSVKELLGHSSLASTQVYTHNSITELKKAHSAHPRSKE